ncbi:biotin--[acetyl-CoA-carboxylase] ligase, partial [Thioclava sp. BHET1]
LESLGQGQGVSQLAIGIGVTLIAAPGAAEVEPGALRPVSLLEETGARVTPEEFLDLLAPAYARYEQSFTRYGFAPIREAWLMRAARLGKPVTARTGQEVLEGTFETVDARGALMLRTAGGLRAVTAAEVFF